MNYIATKLYIPPPRSRIVPRPRLDERLNGGLDRRLTLVSAPAGFGKTTLVSEWCHAASARMAVQSAAPTEQPSHIAWLSLDEGDNDPARFLTYLIAALQTIDPKIGANVLGALQSPQPPPPETILTALLNELASIPDDFVLVLDDYHVIDSKAIDHALTFLLEHLPPRMRLVIATREDPDLPLARLRGRDQLSELRAADLRFTPAEAADFLNRVMGLQLSAADIAALETRTEGWIAGLQLASLALRGQPSGEGQPDTAEFIKSFTGSHRFVLDYLAQEVFQQQPEHVQSFLLRTCILDRMCGPLCDAVLEAPAGAGQETLEYIERANLFIVPLDNERRWYRYHHLFADLLRQRLRSSPAAVNGEDASRRVQELHIRASEWYEEHGLELEAFQHAVAAQDVERAERLSAGRGIPLHLRGAVTAVLDWLASLSPEVLNARPRLWIRHAQLLLIRGETIGVEEKLQAAEAALVGQEADPETRPLVGNIATARATLALTRYQVDTMLTQSMIALEYLPQDNVTGRASAYWTKGYAHFLQKDYQAATQAYVQGLEISRSPGGSFTAILCMIGLGNAQEIRTRLPEAAETYRTVLHLAGEQPLQIIYEAYLGLARILYEWNDLDAAEVEGRRALLFSRQYETIIDRYIVCELFLSRVKFARGDVAGASLMVAQADQSARGHNFIYRIPEVVAAQIELALRQGDVTTAAELAAAYPLPMSRALVHIASGEPAAALTILEQLRGEAEANHWPDERLRAMILQAVALAARDDTDAAVQTMGEVLALAEPGGYIRPFVDRGAPVAQLVSLVAAQGKMPDYTAKLLSAFRAETPDEQPPADESRSSAPAPSSLIEPLTPRELEILQCIARGLSNREISEQLYLALDTVKGHNQKIFGKLQVARRTEAVARAHELGLL